jgi:tetratricopeptide (TPR) repeat protein
MNIAVPVPLVRIVSLSLIAGLSLLSPAKAQLSNTVSPQPIDPNNPSILNPNVENNSLLSVESGQNLMKESDDAVAAQKYDAAEKKLQAARQIFNQLSNFYQDLNASFSGIDNRISDYQRQKALEAAQLRDESSYRLALVHQAENQSDLAIPLLIQVLKSQNPTRELGRKAYQKLLELGFIDVPYPKPDSNASPSAPQKTNGNASPSAPQTTNSVSLLSIDAGDHLVDEAQKSVAGQKYDEAVKQLQSARQVFNQLSNLYEDLNASFSGIDDRVADAVRKKALETAQKRDEATYQLSLVHRAQNQPELAVPLLVQIIKSQNPTRDLGKKAYQQLFELGFVNSPYPRKGGV